MNHIWGFFIQTSYVSVIAFLLIAVKKMLKDKLSLRWQYMIWIILFVSILIPIRNRCFPLMSSFFETIKFMIESNLSSNYIHFYEPIENQFVFPMIQSMPASLTDYLFVIYVGGVIVNLIYYVKEYVTLRSLIKNYAFADSVTDELIQQVSKKYALKPCKVVCFENCSSAFVFGIIHPVLVIPKVNIDEKILLHELLHQKYKDSLQSVMWSVLKCLHWCNPFLRWVFNQISNDMESLCDQRVLELVEGEERREYGRILLAMTNEKYPYAFGTTSLSNGGKQIKKRIEAISRFKKYPKGMGFVSVCIGCLFVPVLIGTHVKAQFIPLSETNPSRFLYQFSMASARQVECTTIAGAIDMYAKGLLTDNNLYLMSVMPQSQYENYLQVFEDKPTFMSYGNPLYTVFNLKQMNEFEYEAYLLFENPYELDENKQTSYFLIRLVKEKGWKIEKIGDIKQTKSISHYANWYDILPCDSYVQNSEHGELVIQKSSIYDVENEIEQDNFIFASTPSLKPNPQAEFDMERIEYKIVYHVNQWENKNVKRVGITVENLYSIDQIPSNLYPSHTHMSGATNDYSYNNYEVNEEWNGEIKEYVNILLKYEEMPKAFNIIVSLDGKKVDEIKINLEVFQ